MSDDSQGPTTVVVILVFSILGICAVLLRLWARMFLGKRIWADDYLVIVALVLSCGFGAVSIVAVKYGLGEHIEVVMARGDMLSFNKCLWVAAMFYNSTLGLIKMSVLILYTRLGDRTLRKASIVMIGVMIVQTLGNVSAATIQCIPIEAAYDVSLQATAMCMNVRAFYLGNAAVNIFTDLLTYTLPIKMIINLKVSRRTQISLFVILCLGLIACLSSIIRITTLPRLLGSEDITYEAAPAFYWSSIEPNVGILAASIPSYKQIALRYMPRLLRGSSTDPSSGANNKPGRSSRSKSNPALPLDSLNRGKNARNFDFATTICPSGRSQFPENNSSEEALYKGTGGINVTTRIQTFYDSADEERR